MPNYRRNLVPGGTYFFTANLADRQSGYLVEHIDTLRNAVRRVLRARPFHIDAWVVLPDHMHCVWTLPPGDHDYSGRWRALKTAFAKRVPRSAAARTCSTRTGERGIWQRRFWEHTILSDDDYAAHVDYVHINPMKHGWVNAVADWPYSTFHRYVREGVYPADWGGGLEDRVHGGGGER